MRSDEHHRGMLRPTIVVAAALLVLVAATALWQRTLHDPSVVFLQTAGEAVWLRPERPFNGSPQSGTDEVRTVYRTSIACKSPNSCTGAVLKYRSLRAAEVRLDGKVLADVAPPEEWNRWQEVRSVELPDLPPGEHELVFDVRNRGGPALLQAWSTEITLKTTNRWEARLPGEKWMPAKSVEEPWIPQTAREAPSTHEAIASCALPIAVIFGFWLAVLWGSGQRAAWAAGDSRTLFTAARVRWSIFALWALLACNNELKLPFFGFDSKDHSDYMRYLLEHRRIPLADEGWQMFQAPLYHLLGAAIYGPVSFLFRESYGWHAVRLMTLACGMMQVEVCYRAVRRVFPGRDDVQIMGTLIGGLLPMNIYMSHALGNEPLAGLLTAMTFIIGLGFLDGDYADKPKWQLLLGVTWGLAMLTKVTPVLLSLPLLVMCLRGMVVKQVPVGRVCMAALRVLGTAGLVCGWYYVRNWVLLGSPFVGGWNPARGIEWWQDPGYRVAEHFLSFGEALRHPIYAGHAGLWDGLYSTMWLDGYLLGTAWDGRPPWNDLLLISMALLSLIPLLTMFVGGMRAGVTRDSVLRWTLLLCLSSIGIYLAAITYLYLKLPIYSTGKATYFLGLLPCFAILAAAGCDVVRRSPLAWRFLQAALLTWATCVYATYFII